MAGRVAGSGPPRTSPSAEPWATLRIVAAAVVVGLALLGLVVSVASYFGSSRALATPGAFTESSIGPVTTSNAPGTEPPITAPTVTATTARSTVVPVDMLNLAVSQATISATICTAGYTARIRPATTLTGPIKVAQIASYGYAATNPGGYEEDHVISLEVGGSPTAAANLFPEPLGVARADDGEENKLHAEVCAGSRTLAEAQSAILALKTSHGYRRTASLA